MVYDYDVPIPFENFTVYYQESAEDTPKVLAPATAAGDGFLINGKKSVETDRVIAGRTKADSPGKYGDFRLTFTSSEDPTAVPYEFKIFVVATQVISSDNPAPLKLEVVREPTQTVYDRGEPFISFGMIVVAWYNDTSAGETIESGGKPLRVPEADLTLDDSKLTTATSSGENTYVAITYTYGTGGALNTKYYPTLQIAQHPIITTEKSGLSYSVSGYAHTGAYVTVGIKTDEDYELVEQGLTIEYLNKDGSFAGFVTYTEIAPDSGFTRFVFIMPRFSVKITAEATQKASGLGSLEYKFGAASTYENVPGFVSGSHHLKQQLIIASDQGTQAQPLFIRAGPPDDLQGGTITISIYKEVGNTIISDSALTDGSVTPVVKVFAEAEIDDAAEGNTDYKISILYAKTPGGAATARDYQLRIMKEDADTSSITFTYTGSYQIFAPTRPGTYKIQAWGANGGDAPVANTGINANDGQGGKGGYVEGQIVLNPNSISPNEKMPLYIYVGGKGGNYSPASPYHPGEGGWNGGGRGGNSGSKAGGGGGGATSISVVAGTWNSVDVLGNRIMVAGGGGGASPWGKGTDSSVHSPEIASFVNGSTGGGLYGSPAQTVQTVQSGQTVPGRKYGPYSAYLPDSSPWTFPSGPGVVLIPAQSVPPPDDPTAGFNEQGFGQGGYGRPGDLPIITSGDGYNGKGGGGGGWWGGRVSTYTGAIPNAAGAGAGGGGGSNYISGHDGCRAVSSVKSVQDQTTFEYTLQIISSSNSKYYGSSGSKSPTEGSPSVGDIEFTNTDMNSSEQADPAPTDIEANPNDPNLNNSLDGNGRVVITYMGS